MTIPLNKIAEAVQATISMPSGAAGFIDNVNQTIENIKKSEPSLQAASDIAQSVAAAVAIGAAVGLASPGFVVTAAGVAGLITLYKNINTINKEKGLGDLNIGDLISVLGNVVSVMPVGGVGKAAEMAFNLAGATFTLGGILQNNVPGGLPRIINEVRNDFNASIRWRPRRDPLTLDLDGDGLETIGASDANPIYFDHDADGVKTST